MTYQKWLTKKEDGERDACTGGIVQAEVHKTKNEHWKKLSEEIKIYAGNTKTTEVWRILKALRTQNNDKSVMYLINLSKYTKYYKTLLTEDRAVLEAT